MNTFDIAVKNHALPATMEELVPLTFMGRLAVKAYTEKIKAMKELGIAEEQRAATLSDGQDAGEMLIRIETRIGEICSRLETKSGKGGGNYSKSKKKSNLDSDKIEVQDTKTAKIKEMKLPKTKARNYEIMNANPEAVEQAIAKAREEEEIPTCSDVINIVHSRDKASKQKEKSKMPDLNESVIKVANNLRSLCNSMSNFSDHWNEISDEAKSELGKSFKQLNRIFREIREQEVKDNE
jgi:hypothetical protein